MKYPCEIDAVISLLKLLRKFPGRSAGRGDRDDLPFGMKVSKDSVLIEDAFHPAYEDSCFKRLGKHPTSHKVETGCAIVSYRADKSNVAKALIFFRKPLLEEAALIEPHCGSEFDVEALTNGPNHRRDCGVPAPNNATTTKANGHKFANGELDQERICGLKVVATTLNRDARGQKDLRHVRPSPNLPSPMLLRWT